MVREGERGASRNEASLSTSATKEFTEVPGFLYEGVWAD